MDIPNEALKNVHAKTDAYMGELASLYDMHETESFNVLNLLRYMDGFNTYCKLICPPVTMILYKLVFHPV